MSKQTYGFQKKQTIEPEKVQEVPQKVIVESEINFAEYISDIDFKYIEAFKVFAKVSNVMEDLRTRDVWKSLYAGFLGYKTK